MCDKIGFKFYVFLLIFVSGYVYADFQDPTQPVEYRAEDSEVDPKLKKMEDGMHIELDEILISGDSKLAIVNDRVVRVGDEVGENKVKSIDTYQVILTGPKGQVELHLFGHPIKEPSK